jgi:hypothetical protein
LIPKFDRGWAIDLITKQKYEQQVAQYPQHFENILVPQIDDIYLKGRKPQGHWI